MTTTKTRATSTVRRGGVCVDGIYIDDIQQTGDVVLTTETAPEIDIQTKQLASEGKPARRKSRR